jgi:hypothetical protein
MVPGLGYDSFLPNPFQFISHPVIKRYVFLIFKASLNNLRKRETKEAGVVTLMFDKMSFTDMK